MSAAERLTALLEREIVLLDGSWGVLIQREVRGRGRLSRRTVPGPPARRGGRPGPPQPHEAGHGPRHPPLLLRRRRPHRDDEHVHRHIDRAGGLRARAVGGGDERRGRSPRPASRRRGGRVRRRVRRPAQRHAVAVTEGRRSCVSRRHVRRGLRRLRRADGRSRRRRRRSSDDRDRVRHAEREGCDRRSARRRATDPALDLIHRHRRERAQPVGADGRSVLALRRARRAADRRRQLLARRDGDAPVRRRPGGGGVDVRVLPPERGPSERAGAPRRAARRHEPLSPRVRGGRARQHRRRLLRDDPGSRAGDRGHGEAVSHRERFRSDDGNLRSAGWSRS